MQDTYKRFTASEIYCPRCRRASPVRERLLLVLPGHGELHDLICAVCGEPLAKRTESAPLVGAAVPRPPR